MFQLAQPESSNVKVQSWNAVDSTFEMSPVVYWLHRLADPNVPYVNIKTETGESLHLTGEHLIYMARGCDNSSIDTVRAEQVETGACVMVVNGATHKYSKVVSTKRIAKTGIYSPVTEVGTVVVSNVVASCFVSDVNADGPIMSWASGIGSKWTDVMGARTDGHMPVVWQALEKLQHSFFV